MKRVVSVFCVVTAFLVLTVAGQAIGCNQPPDEFDPWDYTFVGDIDFNLNGIYTMDEKAWLPLNVRGNLNVLENETIIGNLNLYGQKTHHNPDNWDGISYFGDWVFNPAGCIPCDSVSGLLNDFLQFGESEVEFTLGGLPGGDDVTIAGTFEGDEFVGSAVPIPTSVILLGTGLVGLLGLRRKKSE